MASQPLAPGLLLATPALDGSAFERAVILLLEHDDEGTFGVIVNRPTNTSIEEIAEETDLDWIGEGVVWHGGPVDPSEGRFIGFDGAPSAEWIEVTTGVLALAQKRPSEGRLPQECRFILGHAGWSPGQLSDEIADGAWLSAPIDVDLIISTDPDQLWHVIMQRLGVSSTNLAFSKDVN